MANTLSSMTNGLRNLVSGKRRRYKEKGFNLDLAYICNNIIAMGYPADNIESIYRNRLEDVYKFLEENHHGHYKIYNLCLERNYDKNKFHGRVAVYPFEDHNPPTIELIQKFCEDVDSWLKLDEENVAAVHCKAGKGRTGTMICCYLLFSGQQSTAEDALACYDDKRTKDRKGVTIPSQRRYVQYFSYLIRTRALYERRYLQLCEIRFTEANVLQNQGMVHCSISVLQDTSCAMKVQQLQNFQIDFRKSLTLDMTKPAVIVSGDIKVELTHKAPRKKIFHFWFNTFFVRDSAEIEIVGGETKLIYTLYKYEIDDAHKDKDHKCFSDDFKVQLVFYADSPSIRNHVETNSHGASQSGCLTQGYVENNSDGSDLNHDHKSSSSASVSSLGGGESSGCFVGRGQRNATADNGAAANKCSERNANGDESTQEQSQRHFGDMFNDMDKLHNFKSNFHHKHLVNAYVTVVPASNKRHPNVYVAQPHQQHLHQPSRSIAKISRDDDSNGIANINCDIKKTHSAYISSQTGSGSSKSSSISSHSSSSAAVGGEENEEDWESGESSTKQLAHNALQLFSSLTRSSSPATTYHTPSTHASNVNPAIAPLSFNSNISSSYSSSRKGTNNVCTTDDYKTQTRTLAATATANGGTPASRSVQSPEQKAALIAIPTLNTVEITRPQPQVHQSLVLPTTSKAAAAIPASTTRYKFMHLFSPKVSVYNSIAARKPFFKRKSSGIRSRASSSAFQDIEMATASSSSGCAGLATTSKQNLKIKLKKNKLRLTQWFQNYSRTVPLDFCENVVQQTTAIRRNSNCNIISRNLSMSIAMLTPSSPPLARKITSSLPSCPDLATLKNAASISVMKQSSFDSICASNASFSGRERSEDYYSFMCDNQLSFNNSPCKSPRSLTSSNNCNNYAHNNLHTFRGSSSLFHRRTTDNECNEFHRQQTCSVTNHGDTIIVASKPAHSLSIGFKVIDASVVGNVSSNNCLDTNCDDTNTASSSIYYTPSSTSDLATFGDCITSPFIFTKMKEEIKQLDTFGGHNTDAQQLENNSSLSSLVPKEYAAASGLTASLEECSIHRSIEYCAAAAEPSSAACLKLATGKYEEDAFNLPCSQTSGFSASDFCTHSSSSSSSCNCNPLDRSLERLISTQQFQTPVLTIKEARNRQQMDIS